MDQQVPLIWFYGVGVGRYQPIYPVYLVDEEPEKHQFVVAIDASRDLHRPDSRVEETLRRYVVAETKRRLHQPVFRATVMRAYETRCAVCALAHGELLDAAHIVPDGDEMGIASVRNGMALCKIHHAAYDARILGISPDLVVEIREDLLDEVDGPMLEYGLKERHSQPLMVLPKTRAERPIGSCWNGATNSSVPECDAAAPDCGRRRGNTPSSTPPTPRRAPIWTWHHPSSHRPPTPRRNLPITVAPCRLPRTATPT